MAEQKTKSKKNVKKSFFDVEAPMTSTRIQLYAATKEELINKTVKLDLTKNLRGKNLEVVLRVKESGDKLIAEPEKVHLLSSYVQKGVRKGTDYAEDSFDTECRDVHARIKLLMVTRRRVSRAVLKALRDEARKMIEPYTKTRNAREIISEIMTNKLQKQLSLRLKKIYPLALCEVRVFEVLESKAETAPEAEAQ